MQTALSNPYCTSSEFISHHDNITLPYRKTKEQNDKLINYMKGLCKTLGENSTLYRQNKTVDVDRYNWEHEPANKKFLDLPDEHLVEFLADFYPLNSYNSCRSII